MVDTYFIALTRQMPCMVLMGFGLVTICTFQSMGKGIPALMLSICRQGVVYAVVIGAFSALFGYTGVISAQLGSDVISFFIAIGLFVAVVKPVLQNNW